MLKSSFELDQDSVLGRIMRLVAAIHGEHKKPAQETGQNTKGQASRHSVHGTAHILFIQGEAVLISNLGTLFMPLAGPHITPFGRYGIPMENMNDLSAPIYLYNMAKLI